MTKYQRRCDEMFARVCGFEENHRARFPEGSPGGLALAEVRAARADVDLLLLDQLRAVDDRRERARTRVALIRFMRSITLTARRIARQDRTVTGRFIMPDPRTDGSLLDAARRCARDLVTLEDRFIALGMPPTFLTDLAATIDRFDHAVRRRRDAQVAASAAKAGLLAAFRRGFEAVLTMDVVVNNVWPVDPVLMATWQSARRIDRTRSRRQKKAA